MIILSSVVQFVNIPPFKNVVLSGKTTLFRDEHPGKSSLKPLVPFGISIYSREVQLANARFSIVFMLSGSSMASRA